MKRKLAPYVLLAPQIILTILFMIGLGAGITQSFGVIPAFGLKEPTLHYYKEICLRQDMVESIFYSLKIAFFSALGAAVIGTALCGLCVSAGRTKGMFMRILQLPVAVPHVVTALFVVSLCSQNGLIARIACSLGFIETQQEFPMLIYDRQGIGVILAYLWKEIPFIIYFVIALMANINDRLGEAAVNLGASRLTAFCRITLPLCWDTIVSGFLILFVFALGAYELPFLLGATKPKALPVLAYQQYMHPDLRNRPYAMALNGMNIAISLVSAVLYFWLMNRQTRRLAGEKKRGTEI